MSQLPIVTKLVDHADRSFPAYHGFIKADIREAARIIGALYEALEEQRGFWEGQQILNRAMTGEDSLRIETAIEKIDASLALARGADAQAEGEK